MFLNTILATIQLVFNPARLLEALPYMGFGMLGIFIVMGVIILIMTVMGKIEATIEKRKAEKSEQIKEYYNSIFLC